ncbi:MAG: nucleotidyltransferase family protein [Flavobacteriales bacterium]
MNNEEIKKRATKIIRHHLGKNVKIYLFGSQAKGNTGTGSDIYIAVSASKENREAFMKIKRELSELPTLKKIDVINLSFTKDKFKDHIFKHAVKL